jgi:hypothetical protein
MIFDVVLTNLETHNFTTPSTFHGPAIGNYDLKMIDDTNIAIIFLGNGAMNKIMGASTINKNDDLHMLNVTNYVEGLGRIEAVRSFMEMIGFTLGGSEGGVMSMGLGDTHTRGASTLTYETSFEMAIKIFCSLHLCPRKYLSSQL